MRLKITRLPIKGTAAVDADPFVDHRGAFCRFFCNDELSSLIGDRQVVNVNFSRTAMVGAVRGVHFQYPPCMEMKLIRCQRGKVFDVLVDLRKGSPTFLQWHSEILSPDNMRMLVVPEGVAHGFQVLEEKSEMLYLHTAPYVESAEGRIRYDDPRVGIAWPLPVSDVSHRDQAASYLEQEFLGVKP